MSELLNLFSSPVFWFATVFLSFFINLASAYIKPWIDDRLAQFSAQRKRLNELKKSQLDEAVSNMIFEETAVINEKVDLIRYLLRPTLIVTTAILIYGIVDISIRDFLPLSYSLYVLTRSSMVVIGLIALVLVNSDVSKSLEISRRINKYNSYVESIKVVGLLERRKYWTQTINHPPESEELSEKQRLAVLFSDAHDPQGHLDKINQEISLLDPNLVKRVEKRIEEHERKRG